MRANIITRYVGPFLRTLSLHAARIRGQVITYQYGDSRVFEGGTPGGRRAVADAFRRAVQAQQPGVYALSDDGLCISVDMAEWPAWTPLNDAVDAALRAPGIYLID